MANQIALVFLGLSVIYLVISLTLPIAYSWLKPQSNPLRRFSILVAVRNEAAQLDACLASLAQLQYPAELLDIWILDDNSSDNTARIAQKYCQTYPHFHYLHIRENIPGLRGKMNALAQGIRCSQGEFILITDADCRVPPSWVHQFNAHFNTGVGMVAGMNIIASARKQKSTLWEKIQRLDLMYLLAVAAGMANGGFPITALGNNWGFRRSTYRETGGFEAIGFSLTEDFALVKAMVKLTSWKLRYVLSPAMAVTSQPLASLKAFYQQRKRWIVGGRSARPITYFLAFTSWMVHLGLLTQWILMPRSEFPLLQLSLVIGADLLVLFPLLFQYRQWLDLLYIPLFKIFFAIYLLYFGIATPFFRKVEWKGRTYPVPAPTSTPSNQHIVSNSGSNRML